MKSKLTPTKLLREVYVSPEVTLLDLQLEGVLCGANSNDIFKGYHFYELPDYPGFGYDDYYNGEY